MPYQPLVLDPLTPPSVRRLISRLEGLSFSDVHTMLRLPQPASNLTAGCNFAVAYVLLAAVGGISTTLYRQGKTDGERFKGLLTDHYPWNLEPIQHVGSVEASRIIYEVFRNPLTHDLGLDLRGKAKGLKVVVKRLQSPAQGGGLPEQWIENLERGRARPNMSSTVSVRENGRALLVEALYWGLRRMVEAMTRDTHLMAKAERFLANRI